MKILLIVIFLLLTACGGGDDACSTIFASGDNATAQCAAGNDSPNTITQPAPEEEGFSRDDAILTCCPLVGTLGS